MLKIKHYSKRLTAIFLTVILALFSFTLCVGAATPRIYVQSVKCEEGSEISVDILIENNPGIIATLLRIDYDPSVLTLLSAENGSVFKTSVATFGNDISAKPYTLMWEDSLANVNITTNGTLATLKFKVADDVSVSKSEIELTCDKNSTFNTSLQRVEFSADSGNIEISQVRESIFVRVWKGIVSAWETITNWLKAVFSFVAK